MVYRIFVDSDIILDVLLKREEFYRDSYAIFNLCDQGKIILYTSSSIILNVQYIGTKLSTIKKTKETILDLVENFIEIINPTKQTILKSYKSDFLDLEDAVQYYTAVDSGIIDYIITRNLRDYKKTGKEIPVITASQLLNQLK